MEEIVIILIVGLAAWYLIRRYLKNKKTGGGCDCANASCDIKNTCSTYSGDGAVFDKGPGIGTGERDKCPMNTNTPDD